MMQRGNDRARQEIQSQTAMCRKACRIRRTTSWPDHFTIQQSKTILARSCEEKALTGSAFLRMPGVNRQGQAHRGLRQRPGFEHGFPLIRSLRASAPRSTSVLFSFVLSLLIVAGPFAIRQSKTILARCCEAIPQATEWQHIGN
jgi:hypothetical protein